ncbi:MAG: YMGG-like glycine zipper-containing protein, partial [Candidatus Binatia bacterium]
MALSIVVPVLLGGCASGGLSAREKGALAGGAIGAGTGAIIGHNTKGRHKGRGAAIGGAAGALGGWIIGDQIDAANQRRDRYDDDRYDYD